MESLGDLEAFEVFWVWVNGRSVIGNRRLV